MAAAAARRIILQKRECCRLRGFNRVTRILRRRCSSRVSRAPLCALAALHCHNQCEIRTNDRRFLQRSLRGPQTIRARPRYSVVEYFLVHCTLPHGGRNAICAQGCQHYARGPLFCLQHMLPRFSKYSCFGEQHGYSNTEHTFWNTRCLRIVHVLIQRAKRC